MEAFEIGVLNIGECVLNKRDVQLSYAPRKVYLGRNRTLPSAVSVSLKIKFKTAEDLQDFFVFFKEKTLHGAKPFYAKLPFYGVVKHYLVLLDGELQHQHDTLRWVSGKFILYRNRTLDENIVPVFENKTFTFDMDTKHNFLLFQATDVDDVLTYNIVTQPTLGTVVESGDGGYYYSPTVGVSGVDAFTVQATDELGASATATASITIINWQSELAFATNVQDINNALLIEYVNQDLIDASTQQQLLSLIKMTTTLDADGNVIGDYSSCTTIANMYIDSEGNLIVVTT